MRAGVDRSGTTQAFLEDGHGGNKDLMRRLAWRFPGKHGNEYAFAAKEIAS
jgi:hypothetical protein